MFGYIFSISFSLFHIWIAHTRWSCCFFLSSYVCVCVYNGYDNDNDSNIDNKNDNNKLDRLYLYTNVFIYNKKRKTCTKTHTPWLKHIANVGGSFAKKALVQTIVCLVLCENIDGKRQTDRQTCMHTQWSKWAREWVREWGRNRANADFGNETEKESEKTRTHKLNKLTNERTNDDYTTKSNMYTQQQQQQHNQCSRPTLQSSMRFPASNRKQHVFVSHKTYNRSKATNNITKKKKKIK